MHWGRFIRGLTKCNSSDCGNEVTNSSLSFVNFFDLNHSINFWRITCLTLHCKSPGKTIENQNGEKQKRLMICQCSTLYWFQRYGTASPLRKALINNFRFFSLRSPLSPSSSPPESVRPDEAPWKWRNISHQRWIEKISHKYAVRITRLLFLSLTSRRFSSAKTCSPCSFYSHVCEY